MARCNARQQTRKYYVYDFQLMYINTTERNSILIMSDDRQLVGGVTGTTSEYHIKRMRVYFVLNKVFVFV